MFIIKCTPPVLNDEEANMTIQLNPNRLLVNAVHILMTDPI